MKILQQAVKVKKGARVLVKFSRPANIYLMTEVNFKRYKEGQSFKRIGGEFTESPAEFTAPYDGTWHAIIEKGAHTNPEHITGSVETLPPKRKETPYFDEEAEWEKDHQKEVVVPEIEDTLEEGNEELEDESREDLVDETGEDSEEENHK